MASSMRGALAVGSIGVAVLLGACTESDNRASLKRSAHRGTESTTSAPPSVATKASATPQTTSAQPADRPETSPPAAPDPSTGPESAESFTTEQCRRDPSCPSSEHRTGDACGAQLIADVDGY